MDEREAFLRAIVAHPDDDVPRLVYADWLDEHDEPERAEFIRLQIELHSQRFDWHKPDVRRMVLREQQLLRQHAKDWLGKLESLDNPASRNTLPFVRGFPERVLFTRSMRHNSTPPLSFPELGAMECPTLRHLIYCMGGLPTITFFIGSILHSYSTVEIVDFLGEGREFHLQQRFSESQVQVWRFWAGTAPEFLNHVLRNPSAVAHRVEIVNWYSESSPSRPSGWHRDPREEIPASTICPVKFLDPLEAGFTLAGDLGGGYFAGHLKNGYSALIAVRPDARRVYLTTFDQNGGFSKTVWEDQFGTPWTLAAIEKRFGFELGVIHAKEFRSGRLALKAISRELMPRLLGQGRSEPNGGTSRINDGAFVQLYQQLECWRSFTLELDGVEHRVLFPIDLLEPNSSGAAVV